MTFRRLWRRTFIPLLIIGLDISSWQQNVSGLPFVEAKWTNARKQDALNRTRDLWYHGYNNYMRYAFPLDELRPLSCFGRGPDWQNPDNFGNNDVAANVSLTLLDVLDSFVVLRDQPGFDKAVRKVIEYVSFDVNTRPQVFEITIRALGGLLSGHIYASDKNGPHYLDWYRGELLELAHDLGRRLLPAFKTATGIPYARVNLRHGVPFNETIESCTAGAGSLILEFATLSRLSGDDRFEKAAHKAFFALWNQRSDIGLVGNGVNIWTGAWIPPTVNTIGAGIDSFYEYALKWYIMSGDAEFLDVFQEAYASVMRYVRSNDGFWYRSVWINSGDIAYATTDSLSAFWPGLQVLAGDVDNAIKSHLIYWNLWRRYSGMPEVFDINFGQSVARQYPLRPEFIESTYFLYRATRDSFYLDVGERVLEDIIARAKVECGLTGILDLHNNTRDDRMESFVLSETLKYLTLLFDEQHPIHDDDSNFVFTTEGHILTLNSTHLKPLSEIRRKMRGVEHQECPVYETHHEPPFTDPTDGLATGIRGRGDAEWARHLVIGNLAPKFKDFIEGSDSPYWSENGWCEVPRAVDVYTYDFVLSPTGTAVPEDPHPGSDKMQRIPDGFMITNVTGIRTHIVTRIDGKGYDVTKLGPYRVGNGQKVYIRDESVDFEAWGGTRADSNDQQERRRDVRLHFTFPTSETVSDYLANYQNGAHEITVTAFTSLFGGDPAPLYNTGSILAFRSPNLRVVKDPKNPLGCATYRPGSIPLHSVVIVQRGDCAFVTKLRQATLAGAAGVIVISQQDHPLNPSGDVHDDGTDLQETALVVLPKTSGAQVLALLDFAERYELELLVSVEAEEATEPVTQTNQKVENGQLLYLNGRPLVNLIVIM
ncbi:hypothetical protein SISNIDRAFT_405596 [Sistotremastrum niveocremeum HHB9708]|uniref:alpha-1,2-Mannosidase n=1 Tax=Sistotremastrum niveocremeum HHB9708 TaxID=1314777 RepID=A0A164ZRG5_9AGAM|nr:hypothetical protein SISNIDRAFT_405596 [Sistotremastrum niveocremeum HHB9708]